MVKPIKVVFSGEVEGFIRSMNPKERDTLVKAFWKTEQGLKGDWFKKLTGTDIWEFRVEVNKKFVRVLAFWDGTGDTNTLIICTNGFNKKKNQTPKEEIKKATEYMKRYFIARE